jgi:hypothetical protein
VSCWSHAAARWPVVASARRRRRAAPDTTSSGKTLNGDFHEQCTSAIDEAHDNLLAVMWQIALGVIVKTDENGNFIVEACGQPNMKTMRY